MPPVFPSSYAYANDDGKSNKSNARRNIVEKLVRKTVFNETTAETVSTMEVSQNVKYPFN